MGNKNVSCIRQVWTLNYNSDHLPDIPSLYLYFIILILLDNYRWSPRVASPPRVWQVGWVSRVYTIRKPTVNASRQLSDKIIILYYRMENWCLVIVWQCKKWRMQTSNYHSFNHKVRALRMNNKLNSICPQKKCTRAHAHTHTHNIHKYIIYSDTSANEWPC